MTRLKYKKGRPSKYQTSLKNNPYWEEVKRKVRVRDGHCCRMCGKTYNLEIHHKTYQIGCLVTLCEECHAKVHER